jgi:hypothetical protein
MNILLANSKNDKLSSNNQRKNIEITNTTLRTLGGMLMKLFTQKASSMVQNSTSTIKTLLNEYSHGTEA